MYIDNLDMKIVIAVFVIIICARLGTIERLLKYQNILVEQQTALMVGNN